MGDKWSEILADDNFSLYPVFYLTPVCLSTDTSTPAIILPSVWAEWSVEGPADAAR